jgi:hypothetical protein
VGARRRGPLAAQIPPSALSTTPARSANRRARSSPPLSGTVMALMRMTVRTLHRPRILWFHPLIAAPIKDGVVPSTHRPPSRAAVQEAAESLRRLLDAIDAGELDVSTPRDVALLRRLQGTLAGWNEALGREPDEDDHTG